MTTDIKGGPEYLAPWANDRDNPDIDHPADVNDPDNRLSLGDKVELAAGKQPDTLKES